MEDNELHESVGAVEYPMSCEQVQDAIDKAFDMCNNADCDKIRSACEDHFLWLLRTQLKRAKLYVLPLDVEGAK